MTTQPVSALGKATLRRSAIWPYLVMPLAVLAVFIILHNVRRSGTVPEQDSSFGGANP